MLFLNHRRATPPIFFFNDTATTEIYTLSLHDALPISHVARFEERLQLAGGRETRVVVAAQDRKSTRLNSSHMSISYAVFCLKKKTKHFYLFFLPLPVCSSFHPPPLFFAPCQYSSAIHR